MKNHAVKISLVLALSMFYSGAKSADQRWPGYSEEEQRGWTPLQRQSVRREQLRIQDMLRIRQERPELLLREVRARVEEAERQRDQQERQRRERVPVEQRMQMVRRINAEHPEWPWEQVQAQLHEAERQRDQQGQRPIALVGHESNSELFAISLHRQGQVVASAILAGPRGLLGIPVWIIEWLRGGRNR